MTLVQGAGVETSDEKHFDIIVIGAGNAALSAGLAGREAGARVMLLEKAPYEERGGNSRFAGALFRFPYDDPRAIAGLLPAFDVERVEAGRYPREAYLEDLWRTSDGRTDPALAETLVDRAYDTMVWLTALGVRWALRKSPWTQHGGRLRLTPGAVLNAEGKGVGLTSSLFKAAEKHGIDIVYGAKATGLHINRPDAGITIWVTEGDREYQLSASSVVLASGGFEADASMRVTHFGPEWRRALVRGTRFNTGETLNAALKVGAVFVGEAAGCHATPVDADAPEYGDLEITDETNRLSYPFGVMVNNLGARFIDEAADYAVYTYAKTGEAVLKQPDGISFQLFDQKATHLLEPRYHSGTPRVGDTIESVASQLGIEPIALVQTVRCYNDAVDSNTPFDSTKLDGRGTSGLDIPKSNWALALDAPPYLAYPVRCGITFTYGGIKINSRAEVVDQNGEPIPGLYATGEITGGLFYGNYAAGAGLMFGAVFGRIAGSNAAARARSQASEHSR